MAANANSGDNSNKGATGWAALTSNAVELWKK
jgi:hypothetical protein